MLHALHCWQILIFSFFVKFVKFHKSLFWVPTLANGGPRFTKSWLPIESLFESLEVSISFRHSEHFRTMVDVSSTNLSRVFDDEDEKDEIAVEAKANGSNKRASNLVQGLQINFQDSDQDQEEEEEEPRKKKPKVKNNKSNSKSKKNQGDKIDGVTVEQHRRSMGDQVKSKLRVLGGKGNYGIAANCHVSMSCSVALFRTLVAPNATRIIPAEFDSSTPVVLAQVDSTQQIGKIFGVSKIRDGTRLGSWSASKMDLVFLPKEASGQLRAWWTMHDGF